MNTARSALTSPASRIAATVAGSLATLLAVVAVVRPEMMHMGMIRHLAVGFGL